MTRTLYELAGADPNLRFSPYCWRIKLALAHKNLDYVSVPWRFTDSEALAFSGSAKVPVLVDEDGTVVHDSQAIAEYLEARYPNEASLFGDASVQALTHFIKRWTEDVLHPAITKVVLPDIFFAVIHPKDQAYFRQSREAKYGMTIEEMAAAQKSHMPDFQEALTPLRSTLKVQNFVSGPAPAYADHIVFGALQWARATSRVDLFADDALIEPWMAAVLASYDLSEPKT